MDFTESRSAGNATTYHPPRWRLLLLVLACVFMAAVSYLPAQAESPVLAGLGWALIGFLGLAAVTLLLRAVRPGPSVVIDDRGITDRTTLAPAGLVRWEDITVIRKKEIGRGMGAERLLEIVLRDGAEFHTRPHSRLRRLTERYRAAMKQPLLSIPGSMVLEPLQAVVDDIRARRPELQVLQGPPPPPPRLRWGQRRESARQRPELPRW